MDREDRRAEAQAAFETAVAAGSTSAWAHYRLAQLLWQRPPSPELRARIATLLERAQELAPGDASVLSYLADIRLEQGRAPEALALAEQAVQLEPAVSYHHLAHARALRASLKSPEAIRAARKALGVARTANDRQLAQGYLDVLLREPVP
jgi:tetratricopeptide (TPR) repeat protein